MAKTTHMLDEIDQIPAALGKTAARHQTASIEIAANFAARPPRLIATIGRGSSDHVSTFLRYAFELRLGIPGASIAPSIASVYGRQLQLDEALCLAVSQSGRSPDIRRAAAMAQRGGATVVAIVNDEKSPLAEEANFVIPVDVGPEVAVAATKSFVGSAVAGLRLLATLGNDDRLKAALDALPQRLCSSIALPDIETVLEAQTAFVVGRGPSLGIAQEAALKLKEIVRFPAEAYSSAEVVHGPWQLAETDCALIAWTADSASMPSQRAVAEAFRALGRPTLEVNSGPAGSHLRHDLLEPLVPLPAFYQALAAAALRRGLDPDRPRLLKKITETV